MGSVIGNGEDVLMDRYDLTGIEFLIGVNVRLSEKYF